MDRIDSLPHVNNVVDLRGIFLYAEVETFLSVRGKVEVSDVDSNSQEEEKVVSAECMDRYVGV